MSASVYEQLIALNVGQGIALGDVSVKRTPTCFWVRAPHGNRKLIQVREVLAVIEGKWPCSKCKRALSPSVFSNTSSRGRVYLRAWCNQCESLRQSGWFATKKRSRGYRSRVNAYMRQWRAKNREAYNAYMRRRKLNRALRRVAA